MGFLRLWIGEGYVFVEDRVLEKWLDKDLL